MDKYSLPTSVLIGGKEVKFKSDYRDILYLFEILNDPDLLDEEKVMVCLDNFYETDDYATDIATAINEMYQFIDMCKNDGGGNKNDKPLFSWEQDFNIIVAPINRTLNCDVRGLEYLHWWTFLSAFMEIGECTFNTYVGIREKLNKGKKLEKWEEKIYKDNFNSIKLKQQVDSTTQSLIDEIMGTEV